jgi:hypothetical protein
MIAAVVYALVGVLWALIFADAALTLHGLASGKLVESNQLVDWFTRSPWRLYPLTVALCVAMFFVARLALLTHWALAVGLVAPLIVQRVLVVRRNYRLNVKAW